MGLYKNAVEFNTNATMRAFFVHNSYLDDEEVPDAVYTQAVRHAEEDGHESGHQHAQRQEET